MVMPRTCRARWLLTAGLAFLILCISLLPAPGQVPDQNDNKKPGDGPAILPQSYPGGMYPGIPVTLTDVLHLAVLANLDIAQANLAVEQARVALFQAYAQFVPNIGIGSTYVAHDGQIQNTAGNVQTVDRDSLFVGGGPSIALPFTRALFGPLEARQLRDAARFGRARVANDVLLRIVDAYFDVLRARRQLARLDEVLDFLTSNQESELRGDAKSKSKGLLPQIRSFVKAGLPGGLPSDLARVEAEVVRRTAERVRVLEELRTTSAELSRLLHLNAGYFLIPTEDYRRPLVVPGEPWFAQPVETLVTQGLMTRPELAENQALLAAALTRYRAAKWQPFVPTLSSGLSWGGFGGGPAIVSVRRTTVSTPGGGTTTINTNVLGNSGVIANFGTRTDFDISLFWRLDNAGLGNLAQIRQARLASQQVELRQLQLQDLVVSQVVRNMERMQRAEQRLNIYRAGLFDRQGRPRGAVYRSIALNFLRIKGGQGIPLEVLDSIVRLNDVLFGYAESLSDFDRARYRLLLVMGLPPEGLLDPACLPLPPAPKTPPGPPAPAPVAPPAEEPRVLPPPAPVVEKEAVARGGERETTSGTGGAGGKGGGPRPDLQPPGVPLPPIGAGAPTQQSRLPSRLPPPRYHPTSGME
jgi:outer membrane protein TolC